MTRIALLTVTYNSSAVLRDFFSSVAAQTGVEWRLYAVDNASQDDTVQQLRQFSEANPSHVTIRVNSENMGAAEGNNQAIRAALHDGFVLLLLINNDVVFDAGLLSVLAAGLFSQKCDVVCPRITYADRPDVLWFAGGEFQPNAGYRTVHYGQGQRDSARFARPRSVTYAPTTCLLVTRAAISRAGLLDPAYFAYSEDADWMFRAHRAGLIACYVPEARLRHKVSSLAGHESPFSDRYGTRNRVYFLRKNLGAAQAIFWSTIYLVYCVARWAARRDSSTRLAIKARAWREGWSMKLPTSSP